MLFEFLKYLQPTHYFTLPRQAGHYIYPEPETLPKPIMDRLVRDNRYQSARATRYDLAWQAVHLGYIGDAQTLSYTDMLPLQDQYHFIRKYFHKAWVAYVLGLRLICFNNPFRECRAWWSTRHVRRSSYEAQPIAYSTWDDFASGLLDMEPKVSVIIPTLNRYPYLKDVLTDLEQQDYTHFEVIVIDQSDHFQASFYTEFQLDLKVKRQEEKALWRARNTAINQAQGDYLLFFDDDSRVAPNWISMHLRGLDFFKADVSSGVSLSKVGAEVPAHYSFFKVSDQLDTGNALIKKAVFERIGLFDRQFEKQRMGDGEFGLRIYLNGFLNVSNPYAKRLHLKVGSGGLREMGSWDAFRTSTWNAPRPIPSVLYFFRRYFGNQQATYALLRSVPLSIMPYRFKKNKSMRVLGGLLSVVLLPLIFFQVCKSWHLASVKLKQGPLIDTLE
ncbi:glycosyltransferase family 2 protein [Aestuariivivens sediminis]|uniref:glycosyltransferase family 2 protein n=1 Tax=Aestuariivivens sediminis TaxID=2913557 RepID=UPI001F565DD9|nr:glycosyltransferase family A protein [Aestuariivivens sediminis]